MSDETQLYTHLIETFHGLINDSMWTQFHNDLTVIQSREELYYN